MTATHLFRGNERGEILDSEGKVVGRIVPPEPTEAMWDSAWKSIVLPYRAKLSLHEIKTLFDLFDKATLFAAPADWSQHAVRVPERKTSSGIAYTSAYDVGYFDGHPDGFNQALDAIKGVS